MSSNPSKYAPNYCRAHRALRRVSRDRMRGFSLVEVLISILVLTFGILGMVGMQAAALQANKEAKLQSTAVVLARELADSIRSNKAVGVLATSNPYVGTFSSPLTPTTASYCLSVSATAACTSTSDVANAQMTEWLSRVDAELPGARVAVCFDSAPFDSNGLPQWSCTTGTDGVVVVKIGWTRGSTNRTLSGSSALERASDTGSRPGIVIQVTAGNAI